MTEADIQMQKAILWEQAKGQLRAMVAVEGHRRLCHPMTVERERAVSARWVEMEQAIEAMITAIEDEGWCE